MKYILSKNILEKFPTTSLAIITLRNVDNSGNNNDIINLLRSVELEIRKNISDVRISEHPRIKMWRTVYSDFGSKPSKYNCSIEAMIKRIMKNESIPDINDIVNLYNYISLKHLISVGGDDADKIDGDVILTIANGDEKFIEIEKTESSFPDKGEVVFKDDKDILGRKWNWRQSDKTKITKESKNANLQIEGIYPVARKDIEEAGRDLIGLARKFFNVEAEFYYLNNENEVIDIK